MVATPGKIEKAWKFLSETVPEASLKFWDKLWGNPDELADTQKVLAKAEQERKDAQQAKKAALKDERNKQTAFDNASKNLTDKENLLKLSQDYLSNVITHPDIKLLYDRILDPAASPISRKNFARVLTKRLTPNYVGGKNQYHTDPEMDRALALLDYLYPNVYQKVAKRKKPLTVDDIYDEIFVKNLGGTRDFTQFNTNLTNVAQQGLNDAQAAYDAEKMLTKFDPTYLAAEKALSKAGVNRIDKDAALRVSKMEHQQALANAKAAEMNHALRRRGAAYLTYGLPLGGAATGALAYSGYPLYKDMYDKYFGESEKKEITPEENAAKKMVDSVFGVKPDSSIQGRSMMLDGMAPVPAPVSAPAQTVQVPPAPEPDPVPVSVPQEQPKAPPPVDNSQIPEAAVARAMVDNTAPYALRYGSPAYLQQQQQPVDMRQWVRQKYGMSMSPAEMVQRGIMPYEYLQYF